MNSPVKDALSVMGFSQKGSGVWVNPINLVFDEKDL
jgi:hypothetical protein